MRQAFTVSAPTPLATRRAYASCNQPKLSVGSSDSPCCRSSRASAINPARVFWARVGRRSDPSQFHGCQIDGNPSGRGEMTCERQSRFRALKDFLAHRLIVQEPADHLLGRQHRQRTDKAWQAKHQEKHAHHQEQESLSMLLYGRLRRRSGGLGGNREHPNYDFSRTEENCQTRAA